MIIGLVTTAILTGCSTIPQKLSTPNPDPEKYTFQVIGIEIPNDALHDCKNSIELISEHPSAIITEYPIVVVNEGESASNDQTKPIFSDVYLMAHQ